jgi:DnaJ-class molecular chaperone
MGGWPGARGGRVRVNVGGVGVEDLGGFSEFFRTFFGGGGGFGGPGGGGFGGAEGGDFGGFGGAEPAGGDLEATLDLGLEDVLRGATRTLRLADGASPRTVEVKIPPGVREGSRVRVAGEGGSARKGPRGDLYLRVHLTPHPRFDVKGDDLHTTVNVPLTTAVLGGEAEVPTLEGTIGIKIPAGTPNGRVFRLRGHGLPKGTGRDRDRGDLMATLSVEVPQRLTDREKELFEELKRLGR